MKTIKIILTFALLFSAAKAQNIEWKWALQGGGNSWDHGYAIAIDNDNNVLIRGKFVNVGYFGDTSIKAVGAEEDYLAKYTEDGQLIWIRILAGKASWEKDRTIAIDENNNIYLTGYFNSPYGFDHINLSPYGANDGYIAKLNSKGEYIWVNRIGGSGDDAGYAIAYTHNKLLVAGYYSDTAFFPSGDLISSGGNDIYVACYDENGNNNWTVNGGSLNNDRAYGIAADQDYFYITGRIDGNAAFDGIHLSTLGPSDLMVAKYDLNGNIIWAVNDASSGELESKTITCSGGDIYLTGKFSGAVTFGSLTLTALGLSDAYIVKFNENGNIEWVDIFTGGFANEGNSITIKDSRVYTIGVFGQSLDIGDTTLNCMGSRDSYVSCYTIDGEFVWASDFGVSTGINHVLGNSIAVDHKGAIYIGGEYSGGASFGGSNLTPIGSFDMFLFKLYDLVIPASTNHYMQKPRLEIYPNPNHGIFEIQTAGQIKIDISIFDNNGKLILKKAVISGQQIDISSFPEGIYYLQKTAEQGQLKKILYIKE